MKSEESLDGQELHSMLGQSVGRYLLVNVVSKRCKQLISGEPRLVELGEGHHSLADVVESEITGEKLSVRPLPGNKLVNVLDRVD